MSAETRIVAIERGTLEGRRPRHAGSNARLGEHGWTVSVPIARITCADGTQGFGFCRIDRPDARSLLGQPLSRLFEQGIGATPAGLSLEFPLWDLMGKREELPVYRMTARQSNNSQTIVDGEFSVRCYDTTLYFDDLHLNSDREAVDLSVAQAREGLQQGHANFKIKVGRGAMHMPLNAGMARDIAIVNGLRSAVGPDAILMVDANNGYNFNLTLRLLRECIEADLYWIEEPFHEDPVLYAELRNWLDEHKLPVRIADGEGIAAPPLVIWAEAGLIQVIQYDIFSYGFSPWLALGRRLDRHGIMSAPHHYGRHLGNYYTGHLAPAIRHFAFVEWDEVTTPGIEAPGYHIEEGRIYIPDTPGFGLELDEDRFVWAISTNGFHVNE